MSSFYCCRKNYESGVEKGSSFAAYYRGQPVVNIWGGLADLEVKRAWKEDTVGLFHSTTKFMAAVTIAHLVERQEIQRKFGYKFHVHFCKSKVYQNLASTIIVYQNLALTIVYQNLASTIVYQNLALTIVYQNLASTIVYQNLASTTVYQNLASTIV